MKRDVVASALITSVCLVGGLSAGVGAGFLINSLPIHAPEGTLVILASIPALSGILGGGALWGFQMAKIHGLPDRSRSAVIGGLGVGLSVFAAGVLLSVLEFQLVEQARLPGVPVHVIYTLLFVPATFLVAAAGGGALLFASELTDGRLRSALVAGVAAALAFLLVDLGLDALGWRVGAPFAAQRATMLVVTFVGSALAAAAGAVLGGFLLAGESLSPDET